MSSEFESWLREVLPKHERLTEIVKSLIANLLVSNGIEVLSVTGRSKTFASALQKIERKAYGNPRVQLTDLSGVRVITYFDSQVKQVSDMIWKTFHVDGKNSLDRTQILGSDKIGYRSVHFVCSLGHTRESLPEYQQLSRLVFEIQVRTVLQHAWAELAHDRSYKFGGGLPTAIQRRLNLYAGMLEVVDSAFDDIANDIEQYVVDLKEQGAAAVLHEDINVLSLERFVEDLRASRGIPLKAEPGWPPGSADVLISELRAFGLHTIADIDRLVTPEFVEAYKREVEPPEIARATNNIVGFVRDIMEYSDINRYFDKCGTPYGVIDWWSYRLLLSRYSRDEVVDVLRRHGVRPHPSFPAEEQWIPVVVNEAAHVPDDQE